LHVYAAASPLRWTDPSGHCFIPSVCWGAAFGLIGYIVYVNVAHKNFEPAEATIATASSAATGGISALTTTLGFGAVSTVGVRFLGGAAVGGVSSIISGDVRLLQGQEAHLYGYCRDSRSRDYERDSYRYSFKRSKGTRRDSFVATGIGIGGVNASLAEWIQDTIATNLGRRPQSVPASPAAAGK
jgi:hypothetical protein